jgi:hypothetical protein
VYRRGIVLLAESAAPAAIFGAGSIITLPLIEKSARAWTANVVFHTLYGVAVVSHVVVCLFHSLILTRLSLLAAYSADYHLARYDGDVLGV